MEKARRALVLYAVVSVLASCGYHLVGKEKVVPGVQSVAIPLFENGTTEPDIERIFNDALREEFLVRNLVTLTDPEHAEAVFRGKITRLTLTNVAHLTPTKAAEARLYVTVDIRCEDRRTGAILWQDTQMTYYRSYPYGSTSLEDYETRRAAIRYIAKQMALRIHDRFMSRFQ